MCNGSPQHYWQPLRGDKTVLCQNYHQSLRTAILCPEDKGVYWREVVIPFDREIKTFMNNGLFIYATTSIRKRYILELTRVKNNFRNYRAL